MEHLSKEPHSPTSRELQWATAAPVPLDLHGPSDVPFRHFEESWVERPAIALFEETAAKHSDRVACEDVEIKLTFGQIWLACRRLGGTIDATVAPNAPVGVLLPNEASYPIAVLACLLTGHPCVMIDRHHPQDRVARIVRDAGVAAMVLKRSDIQAGYLLPAGVGATAVEDARDSQAVPVGRSPSPLSPDAPSFVVYTSGSTGEPKGIVLSQRGVLHRAAELVNAVHLNPDDKVLSLASPSTIAGLQQIFEVMLSGASLVKLDLQRLGLAQVVRTVAERRISMMFSTPAVWRSVSRVAGAKAMLASLRCIQSSGDTLLRIDHDQVRAVLPRECHVLSVYGATEAPALLQWFVTSPPIAEPRVPAGYPLSGASLAVLDEQDRPVKDGEPGELVIRSRFTSLGQWQRGEVALGSLLPDPQTPDLKIYRTGDLVRCRADGLYVVLGRRDRQIKILGNRVELAEIETALREAPGVLDAAAVVQRTQDEPLLLGFVVPRQESNSNVLDLVRRHLKMTLPGYMSPRKLLVIESLPLLPGRKIDEEALLARAASGAGQSENRQVHAGDPSPSRRTLEMVERAWRTALGQLPPGSRVSFETAGGDSLQFLHLLCELERLAGRPLPVQRFHGGLNALDIAAELAECLDQVEDLLAADAPALFLFPPGVGANASLTHFRSAVGARLPIRQIRYPDLRALAHPQASFESMAAYAADQINSLKPEGALVLAGYSDGGDVAYAAAYQLVRMGRNVARLLILDTDATGLSYPAPPAETYPTHLRIRRFLGRPMLQRSRQLIDMIVPQQLLRTARGRALLRLVHALRVPLPAPIAFVAALKASEVLFAEQHRQWSAGLTSPLMDIPVVLFHSQEHRPGAPADLGWSQRTRNLTVIQVPGEHPTMLDGDMGLAIAEEFARLALNV